MDNPNNNELTQAIIQFTKEFTRAKEVVETTRPQSDLGLQGDDAGEFVQAFSQKFAVSLEGFVFEKYFDVEGGFNPFSFIFSAFKKDDKQEISITDLVRCAGTHHWT